VGLSISLIMVGAYAAVSFASLTAPKAVWSANPVTITFSGSAGTGSSGSIGEFVKCAPKVDDVVFHATPSNPTKVSLAVSPGEEATCGPAPDAVTVTAHCIVAAPNCKGTYSGTVSILQGYNSLPPSLAVMIVVT
jgi:hypothetical protein